MRKDPSSDVESNSRRPQFWRVLQRCCQIAGSVDVLMFFLFHALGSPLLAWINVASVALYATAYMALKRRRNRVAIFLIWSEVLGHAAFGTLIIGWESGFHYYLLMFIPAMFASMRLLQACLSVCVLWGFYVTLDLVMWHSSPLQPIADGALLGVHLFNLTVVFGMFAYLAYFYMSMVNGAHRKLQRMATTDSLTQLFNRRHMIYLAEKEIARFNRIGHPIAFLLLDIDHFKSVNDVHGHDVGDKVLIAISACIKAELRTQDYVARWGGEEFLAILPDTHLEAALVSAERVRQAVARHQNLVNGVPLAVTISIGVSEYQPGEELSATIARADDALYRSKQAGRNRVKVSPAQ